MPRRRLWVALSLISLSLTACGGYPRYLNFPFDRGGRSLNSPAEENSPQLAPPFLTFVSDRNGYQGVYVFNIQTRTLETLPGLNALDEVVSHPSISADGRYLAFSLSRQGKTDIYLYDRQTQQKRNLTADVLGETRRPNLSADGQRLAFEVAKDGQWDIMVVDRQGRRLTGP
ncbi:MAG: Tol biopolymer transporter periplasmic protein [Cyanobacteria bacterium RI_101]|nr:Tol biopolymer transporter periplasmic protein [Cyanobacteria bacterium RI_101]